MPAKAADEVDAHRVQRYRLGGLGSSQLCVRWPIARIQLNGLVEVVDALVELGIIKISAASNIGFVSFRICSLSTHRARLICDVQLGSHLIRNRLGYLLLQSCNV